jgi:hypothetical protein
MREWGREKRKERQEKERKGGKEKRGNFMT